MKKFIVDRIEIKETETGQKYIDIYDANNKNWYEEQKDFKGVKAPKIDAEQTADEKNTFL